MPSIRYFRMNRNSTATGTEPAMIRVYSIMFSIRNRACAIVTGKGASHSLFPAHIRGCTDFDSQPDDFCFLHTMETDSLKQFHPDEKL